MENTIEYKGYFGQFRYEDGDEAFHGIVLGLRDVIHFQGTSIAELQQALRDSVEDYLAWCDAEGIAPEKPYTGRFVVRIPPDLHRSISVQARALGVSLNQWVADTLSKRALGHRTLAESKPAYQVSRRSAGALRGKLRSTKLAGSKGASKRQPPADLSGKNKTE